MLGLVEHAEWVLRLKGGAQGGDFGCMLSIETLVLIGGILLFAGVVASKLSDWVGIPTLLVFLVIGMLAGDECSGGPDVSDGFESPRSIGDHLDEPG